MAVIAVTFIVVGTFGSTWLVLDVLRKRTERQITAMISEAEIEWVD